MNCNLAATLQTVNKSFLVIGYGNDLRSDDAIGPRVATIVESWQLPNVEALALPQLTPELADNCQNFDGVIFVDACSLPSLTEVQIQAIEADESATTATHSSDPRSLLALTKILYHHSPQAWLISVPAVNFELGESLSSVAEQGITNALAKIDALLRNETQANQV